MSQDDVKVDSIQERVWKEEGGKAHVEFTSDREIQTEEDLLEYGKIDRNVWYVKKMTIGAHQVSMKLRQFKGLGKNGKPVYEYIPVKKSNWKVSADLARIQPRPFEIATERIIQRFQKIPRWNPRKPRSDQKRSVGSHLVEIGLYDAHFGKYCWGEETGEDYDVEIAEEVYANAVSDLLDRVSGFRISRFVFPVGNDFFHFDNVRGTTTSGTPLDCDTRYARVIEHGEFAVVRAIQAMLEVAPVDVIWVPGNHDHHSSMHLCRFISARFHDCDHITVDTRPRARKYYRFGTCLLGYTHGSEERIADLTRLIAVEVPPDVWAGTTCREIHLGHFHKTRIIQTTDTDEYNGIRVRVNPSLNGADAWHHARGFVGNRRAAQAFIYEENGGFTGLFEVQARRGLTSLAS